VDGVDFTTTLLCANNQIIIAESEDTLQEAVWKLSQTVRKCNLNTSSKEIKVRAFAGVAPVKAKIIVDGKIIEHLSTFKCQGCEVFYWNDRDIEEKLSVLLHITT
jgi:hypothetical protein